MKIYTDGSCRGNPGPGGWAFVVSNLEYRSGTSPYTTNNIMELTAILQAIYYVKDNFPGTPATIYSDSRYCVDGFNTWMHNWEKRNWTKKKGHIKNLELWKEIYDLREGVNLLWVQGHDGDEMNELADALAGEY